MSTPSSRSRSLRLPSLLSRPPSSRPSPAPAAPISPSLTPSPDAPLLLAPRHLLAPLSISRPLSPMSSGLPSPTFSRPASPFRPAPPVHTPTPPLPVSVSLKTVNLPSPTTAEDVLVPGDRIGVGLQLLGERINPVPLGRHPTPEEGGEIAQVVEVKRKIGEGSNACVYLVREVLGLGEGESARGRGRTMHRGRRPAEEEDIFGALELEDDDFPPAREPTRYGREFAIKVLSKRDLSPGQIGTQLVEAQIHQSLPYHPNIVTLHRTLETQSWLLLILEHVPGEDLFYFLEQARDADHGHAHPHAHGHVQPTSSSDPNFILSPSPSSSSSEHTLHAAAALSVTGPLSHTPRTPSLLSSHSPNSLLSSQRLRLIARMFTQMCAAVAFCHANGIAHRDIKPENFIVTEGEAEDGERRVVVKLTDFGLASRERESRDVDCGSAPYMSFECANNVAPTYATQPADVWSLGIVLINMLYHQNPWPRATLEDLEGDGSAEAFAAFKHYGADFFVDRFPGVTSSMAEWLADKVFCEPEHRVGADEFGLWVLDLGGMVDEASVRLLRKARSKQRKDSVRKSKSRAMRSRDAAVGRDAEDGAEGKERGSPPSSREPSIMKRRKRGARSNKSKNSAANSAASLPLPAAAAAMASVAVQAQTQAQVVRDPEAAQLAEHASAVEALAREASMVNGSISTARSGSRTPSLIPSADEPVPPLPLPMSMPMPTTMPLPMATPVSTAATLRARPSVEDEIWLRGRQPTQAALVLPIRAPIGPSAGASWRAHHSPLNPNPQPNPAYASSVSSFAPSTVSTYNTRLSNGSMRSLSTVATTMSDPTSVKSRWSGLKDPSMRSAGSAGSADFSNPNGLGGKELLREMPASPLGKGARVPRTNVKRIEGLPPEIDDLRTPFKTPTPAQRIVHNESKRSLPRKPSTPTKLDPIAERERAAERERVQIERAASAIFQRRDASTSTTSLSSNHAVSPASTIGTVYEERGTPGRAKQGQILTLGKILRGLGTREARN